jgi:hypothetical protein
MSSIALALVVFPLPGPAAPLSAGTHTVKLPHCVEDFMRHGVSPFLLPIGVYKYLGSVTPDEHGASSGLSLAHLLEGFVV